MKRRVLLCRVAAFPATLGLPLLAQAQVTDINDAINKAGRQRMLSQRMAKAYLAIGQQVEVELSRRTLDRSMALFDRQLAELKAFAPTPDIGTTYAGLELAWSEYKAVLVGKAPARDHAENLLSLDAKVLALAHQGTVQLEKVSAKPAGRLVNMAGRQRMLSQRMAKFSLSAAWNVQSTQSIADIDKNTAEFLAAMKVLNDAPEATATIKEQLALAQNQWVFLEGSLRRIRGGRPSTRDLADVFVASENVLSVMDNVTGLYARLT